MASPVPPGSTPVAEQLNLFMGEIHNLLGWIHAGFAVFSALVIYVALVASRKLPGPAFLRRREFVFTPREVVGTDAPTRSTSTAPLTVEEERQIILRALERLREIDTDAQRPKDRRSDLAKPLRARERE